MWARLVNDEYVAARIHRHQRKSLWFMSKSVTWKMMKNKKSDENRRYEWSAKSDKNQGLWFMIENFLMIILCHLFVGEDNKRSEIWDSEKKSKIKSSGEVKNRREWMRMKRQIEILSIFIFIFLKAFYSEICNFIETMKSNNVVGITFTSVCIVVRIYL